MPGRHYHAFLVFKVLVEHLINKIYSPVGNLAEQAKQQPN